MFLCRSVHLPPPPNEEHFLMAFLGFLMVGLYFLGKIVKRTRTEKKSDDRELGTFWSPLRAFCMLEL